MDTDDGDEEIDNYGGAAVGTGDFERRRGWLRSPYGSLLRGVNTRRTTSQDARLKGVSKQLNRINKTVGKKARKSRAKRKRKKNRRAIIVSLIAALLAAVMFFMMFQGIIMLAILGACGSWASLDASNKKKQAALLASSGLCPCGCGCSCGCGTASGGVANLAGYGFTAETGRHGQALNLYMAMLKYIAEKGYDGTEATRMSIPPGFFFERFQREGAIEIFKSNESGRTKWIDPGVTPELLTESTFAGVVNSDKSIFETLAVSKFTTDGGSLNAISHVFPGGYDTEPRHNTDTIDSINIFGALNTTWDTSYTVQCPQEILDVFGVTVPSSIKRGTTGNPLYLPDILWGQIMRGVKDWDVNKNVLPNGLGLDPGLKAVVQSAEAEPYNTALAFGVAWLSGSYARFEGGGTNSTNTVRAPYWNNYSATIFKDVLSGYATLDTLKPFVGRNTGGGDVDAIVSELSGFSPEAADYVRGYLTNYVVTSTIQATIFYGNYLMPIQVAYYIRFFDDWVKDYFPDYGSASGISPVPITNTGVVTDPSDVTADPDADTGADPGDSTANPDDVTADPAVVGPDAPSAVSVTTLEMTSGGGGSCICDASCYCGAGCAAGAGSLSAGGVGTASVGGARLVEIAVAEIAANGGALGGAKYIDGYGSPAVYGYAWCAIFVSWCATQGGFVESGIILKSMSATAFRAAAQSGAHGTWKDRTYVPAPGDLILFDRDGIGEVGLADHIGIVERVDGGKVYTVEGNTSDTVARRSYDIGRSDIDGYVVPAYGLNTASP
jgi:hypothetical protein